MTKIVYRVVHVTPADQLAWDLLAKLHQDGWRIEWHDYAERQYHFLLVADR